MSNHSWKERAECYLSQRRALGYRLQTQGPQVVGFAHFLDQKIGADGTLTIALALTWANQAPSGSPIAKARRLSVARGFARFVAVEAPQTQIPPPRLLGPSHRRLAPTIFTNEQIAALLRACESLRSVNGLRPLTLRTLLGLLAATGLRPSEAVRLKRADVDTARAIVQVCAGKFGRARSVPLHATANEALQAYAQARDRLAASTEAEAFFLGDGGCALTISQADYGFARLRRQLGWHEGLNGRRPRLYDLRHTFVCHRLLAWYQAGEPVEVKLPYLSAYLGHRKLSSTYWYLTAIPELMAVTLSRFEAYAANGEGVS